jgi:molybdate transport system regulatory protein
MSDSADDAPLGGIGLAGEVWMEVDGATLGGARRIALLEAVGAHGSITAAARAVGMSYKGAWDAIEAMNNLAGAALVDRTSGGKGGGGTRLTARGIEVVAAFRTVERAHREFVASLGQRAPADMQLIRRLNMKTSARNQFAGTVQALVRGAVYDEVRLLLASGAELVAAITRESTDALELRPGAQAVALVPAGAIILIAGDDRARYSARNRMAGTIVRLQPGAVHTEVVLELGHGQTLAAIITNDSRAALDLDTGGTAAGIFKASAVTLCVPG